MRGLMRFRARSEAYRCACPSRAKMTRRTHPADDDLPVQVAVVAPGDTPVLPNTTIIAASVRPFRRLRRIEGPRPPRRAPSRGFTEPPLAHAALRSA